MIGKRYLDREVSYSFIVVMFLVLAVLIGIVGCADTVPPNAGEFFLFLSLVSESRRFASYSRARERLLTLLTYLTIKARFKTLFERAGGC